MVFKINTPITEITSGAVAGKRVEISGIIYTARDAIMPKLVRIIHEGKQNNLSIDLMGAAIMHTAFSPSGFGPTSSNKTEIENNMGFLSSCGVKVHIGKGVIKQETINEISEYGAVFIVMPPVSALLQSRLISKRVVAFEEEGMEAMYELKIENLPGVIAVANGKSVFQS